MSWERRDLPARGVVIFGAALAAALALVLVASGALYDVLRAGRSGPSLAPPVAPLEEADLDALRREEAERLGSYGWADRARGVARIPIERAMDLLLERGPR